MNSYEIEIEIELKFNRLFSNMSSDLMQILRMIVDYLKQGIDPSTAAKCGTPTPEFNNRTVIYLENGLWLCTPEIFSITTNPCRSAAQYGTCVLNKITLEQLGLSKESILPHLRSHRK